MYEARVWNQGPPGAPRQGRDHYLGSYTVLLHARMLIVLMTSIVVTHDQAAAPGAEVKLASGGAAAALGLMRADMCTVLLQALLLAMSQLVADRSPEDALAVYEWLQVMAMQLQTIGATPDEAEHWLRQNSKNPGFFPSFTEV